MFGRAPVAPPTVPADDDCKLIADFSKTKVGEFPGDWKPRKDAGKSVYAVQEESGKRFLRVVDTLAQHLAERSHRLHSSSGTPTPDSPVGATSTWSAPVRLFATTRSCTTRIPLTLRHPP